MEKIVMYVLNLMRYSVVVSCSSIPLGEPRVEERSRSPSFNIQIFVWCKRDSKTSNVKRRRCV